MNKFILVIIVCLNYSCDTLIDKTIEGSWSIDSIKVNDQEEITCLTVNIFHFDKDTCSTPRNFCDTFTELEDQQTEVLYTLRKSTNGYYLRFDENSIFYGDSFMVTFYKDPKEKLLKANLKSENVKIIMRKGLYNFDRNIKNIDKLIELTN